MPSSGHLIIWQTKPVHFFIQHQMFVEPRTWAGLWPVVANPRHGPIIYISDQAFHPNLQSRDMTTPLHHRRSQPLDVIFQGYRGRRKQTHSDLCAKNLLCLLQRTLYIRGRHLLRASSFSYYRHNRAVKWKLA